MAIQHSKQSLTRLEILCMACRESYYRHKVAYILYVTLISLILVGSAYGNFINVRYIFVTTWWPFAVMLGLAVVYMMFIHSLNDQVFLNKSTLLRGAEYKIFNNMLSVYLSVGNSHCINLCSSGRVMIRGGHLVICYGKSYHLIPLRFLKRNQLDELKDRVR